MNTKSDYDFDSISELVPRAKSGDREAFSELLQELQGYLGALARKKLNPAIASKEGHSDVVQVTLVMAVESFDKFRGNSAGEFSNWITAILDNTIKQLHRKYSAKRRDASNEQQLHGSAVGRLTSQSPTPGSLAAANDEVRAFHDVLDKLPADYAQVIKLRGLEKKSLTEVSEIMGRSYDSVANLWKRAMLKLEETISESDEM